MIRATLACVLTASIVSGCGGGSGDGATSTAASTETVAGVSVTQGDSYTYLQTTGAATPGATQTSTYMTRQYQTINSDGSRSYTETYSTPTNGMSTNLSATGARTSISSIGYSQPYCTYSGENAGSVPPFSVGKTWDNSWTRTCNTDTGTGTNKGSIVGIESVTVPAGTFSAYKEVYTTTFQQTLSSMSQNSVNNFTCWRDVVLKQRVKCEWTTTNSSLTSGFTGRYELTSYIASGSSSSMPLTTRFAGSWVGSFGGTDSGTCTIVLGQDGTVTGTCSIGQSETFSILGTVNSSGNVQFSAATNGTVISFSGQATSTVAANGTWSYGQSNGTWSARHR